MKIILTWMMLSISLNILLACHHSILKKTNLSAYNPKASELNVQLGMGYMQQADKVLAKSKFLEALRQDPHSPIALGAMGYFFENTHDVEIADQYYRAALAVTPNKGQTLNNYASFLCRQGHYTEAEQYFYLAMQDFHYPKMADLYENVATCMDLQNRAKETLYYLEKAWAQDSKRGRVLNKIIKILVNQKDYGRAQSYRKKCAKLMSKASSDLQRVVEDS